LLEECLLFYFILKAGEFNCGGQATRDTIDSPSLRLLSFSRGCCDNDEHLVAWQCLPQLRALQVLWGRMDAASASTSRDKTASKQLSFPRLRPPTSSFFLTSRRLNINCYFTTIYDIHEIYDIHSLSLLFVASS
jgi:hypothetical protein